MCNFKIGVWSGLGISDEGCMRCNFLFNEKFEGFVKKDYKM